MPPAGVWHSSAGDPVRRTFYLFNLWQYPAPDEGARNTPTPYRVPVARLCRLCRLVAVLVTVAAALGYVTGANAVLWATVLTLGLVGLLIVLQDFIADLYGMAVGGDGSARDRWSRVDRFCAGAGVAAPFALIWGARDNDPSEAWSKVQTGVSRRRLAVAHGAADIPFVFALGYSATRFGVQGAFRSTILPKTHIDPGGRWSSAFDHRLCRDRPLRSCWR